MNAAHKPGRSWWAYVPAGLLIVMVSGLVLMARIAANDPGFAVEEDYYKKAVAWDQHQAQAADNARLGWHVELATERASRDNVLLAARLVDARGAALNAADVKVEAFHNARAADVLRTALTEADGGYVAELPLSRPGLWEFRFTATRGTDTFTQVIRKDLVL